MGQIGQISQGMPVVQNIIYIILTLNIFYVRSQSFKSNLGEINIYSRSKKYYIFYSVLSTY